MSAECWTCEPEDALLSDARDDIQALEETDSLAGLRERAGEALQEFVRLVRIAIELVILLLIIALPWLFRAATVAFAAWAISCAYPPLAERLGGDPPAVLLALAVVLLPLAGALGMAQGAGVEPWGAFLAAGAVIYLLGQTARVASPLAAALAVSAAFAGVVVYALFEGKTMTEMQNEEKEVEHHAE